MSTVKERRHGSRDGRHHGKPKPISPAEQSAWDAATTPDGSVRCSSCSAVLVGFRGRDYSAHPVPDGYVIACGRGPLITCNNTSGDTA